MKPSHSFTIHLPNELLSTNAAISSNSPWPMRRYKKAIREAAKNDQFQDAIAFCSTLIAADLAFTFSVKHQRLFDTGNYSITAKIIEDLILTQDSIIGNWSIMQPVRTSDYSPVTNFVNLEFTQCQFSQTSTAK